MAAIDHRVDALFQIQDHAFDSMYHQIDRRMNHGKEQDDRRVEVPTPHPVPESEIVKRLNEHLLVAGGRESAVFF